VILAILSVLIGSVTTWTTDSLHKIRPDDVMPAQAAHDVHVSAAQNEFEPFQIVLRSGRQAVNGVDVDITDLIGNGGAIPSKPNVTIYLEKYMHVTTPSSVESEAGDWPDALIPRIDRYTGQRRNASRLFFPREKTNRYGLMSMLPVGTPPASTKAKF